MKVYSNLNWWNFVPHETVRILCFAKSLIQLCAPSLAHRILKDSEFPIAIQTDWPHPDFSVFQLRTCVDDSKAKVGARSWPSFSHCEIISFKLFPQPKLSVLNNTVFNFRRNFKNEFTMNLMSATQQTSTPTAATSQSDRLLYI